jgi:DNA-binding winged helix-turn-helix (wHTH) protein
MKHFGPFRLDLENLCVWRADARVPLSPKAFAVLRHLVEHRGQLLTQNQLLDAVWKNLEVQPEILKKYILEVRKALGDHPSDPVYIETLPRFGYRFIADVQENPAARQDEAATAAPRIVGREGERALLHAGLARAAAGRGGVLCLSGGTGIGKTALAEDLLLEASARGLARVLRGRC